MSSTVIGALSHLVLMDALLFLGLCKCHVEALVGGVERLDLCLDVVDLAGEVFAAVAEHLVLGLLVIDGEPHSLDLPLERSSPELTLRDAVLGVIEALAKLLLVFLVLCFNRLQFLVLLLEGYKQ